MATCSSTATGLDVLTGRFEAERTVIRSGGERTRRGELRQAAIQASPKLRDCAAVAAAVQRRGVGYGEDGRPLTSDHKRMVIVAGLP